jgi:hypothetical protein
MRVNEYYVLSDCVERGVQFGMSRAYKHTDFPTEEQIKIALVDAVLLEISEYFNFDDAQTIEIDKQS